MPSGRTHDRVTLWSLPLVASLTFARTQSDRLTLLVAGGFLFGGLMFGPDLDIRSRQYQRWGWLRWMWLPYQRSLRHRSILSHGPILGTVLRIAYLASWTMVLGIGAIVGWATVQQLGGGIENGQAWAAQIIERAGEGVVRSLYGYPGEWLALGLGLEIGAMSHSVCDWGSSLYKRFQKRGWQGISTAKKSKRKKHRRKL
ncbi:metal-binding protein [Oscillatoriales cyanobacterium LEGE 11467]|uniref:Metal-binding protein n=1 Tax=Zarconia navalis LEGE 11467 TaxID=1828826 RepID=A0A928VX50_9CYAN|nr:metal-binding protein [Zarconia navalis]MBE9039285.1 metal-binding protein [Zarconia navalis LEGE 11467]